MNKNMWITVLLDGSVNDSEIKDLICLSYEMIEKRK
jgi:predicted DNA-binding protein (MmcQ/YjbR family)